LLPGSRKWRRHDSRQHHRCADPDLQPAVCAGRHPDGIVGTDRHRPALSARVHCPVCGMENLKMRCEHDVSFVDDVSPEEVTGLAMDLFSGAI
jgi:hypothetical protein